MRDDECVRFLQRAGRGVYPPGSLRELPDDLAEAGFEPAALANRGEPRVAERFREPLLRARHDVRTGAPARGLHLVLCRNLAFTYFDQEQQRRVARGLVETLLPGGTLVLGGHEELPHGIEGLEAWEGAPGVYRRTAPREAPGTRRPPTS